jgi:adenine deaminase
MMSLLLTVFTLNFPSPNRVRDQIVSSKYAIWENERQRYVHIESSMLSPGNFAEAVVPLGVATVTHDPHELTNVFGEEAVVYFDEAAKDLPQRQLANIPFSRLP